MIKTCLGVECSPSDIYDAFNDDGCGLRRVIETAHFLDVERLPMDIYNTNLASTNLGRLQGTAFTCQTKARRA